jgi:hypothetical protein
MVINYEPSDAIVVRNEMSSAADNFHPGFSPESSLMSLSLAGLLARATSVEPSRLAAVVLKCADVFSCNGKALTATGIAPVLHRFPF